MDQNSNITDILLLMVVCGVILFVGLQAVSLTISGTDESGSDGINERIKTAAELDGTSYTTLGDNWGVDQTVFDSRGFAVSLTGSSDSYIASTDPISLDTSENYTVSMWVGKDGVTTDRTALSVKGNIEIYYDASTDNYTAWYYNDRTRDSYNISVSSTANPGTLENIVLVHEVGNSLTIYSNTTAGESVDVSGSNIAQSPSGTDNWDGRLEEVRIDSEPWTSTIRSDHYNKPIAPIGTTHAARVMFDEPYRETQRLFYNSGNVETSNTTFVDGLPGQELEQNDDLIDTGDYDWRKDGPQIAAVSGEKLDGAPVAYVDYTEKNSVSGLRDNFTAAMGLAGLLIVLLPLGVIIAKLTVSRGR